MPYSQSQMQSKLRLVTDAMLRASQNIPQELPPTNPYFETQLVYAFEHLHDILQYLEGAENAPSTKINADLLQIPQGR